MSTISYTDGSSRGNPGPGGWGVIIIGENKVVEKGGREVHTTNNRMELTAVIVSLESVSADEVLDIRTDSTYAIKGATEWMKNWKKNNWRTSAKQPVENQDLWEQIDTLLDSRNAKTTFTYVKGHAGIAGNERADEIATTFADNTPTDLYVGMRDGYESRISLSSEQTKPYYISMVDGKIEQHTTWNACQKHVLGKKGAKFKKVKNKGEEEAVVRNWQL